MEEREHVVGKSVTRVDALEKVTGRAKYTEDLCDKSAYIARVLHADIAHGIVRSVDTSEAQKLSGVVKIVTCFDVPKYYFPTAGHPWSTDPAHQDVKDRLLLTEHVRFYGDDVAAVVAENEVAAAQALRLIKVEYDPLPFVLDVQKAMEEDAPQLHENYPGNVLKHTSIHKGDFEKAKRRAGADQSGGLVSDTDRAALSYREFYLLCVYGTGQVRDRLFYADSSYLQAGCRAGAWNPMGKCASDQAIHRRRFWKQAGHSI